MKTGPRNAKIMIVGEAPGVEEMAAGKPFVGSSGRELTRMLEDASIRREQCFITNVVHERPPGNNIDRFFLKKTAKVWLPGPEIEEGLKELERDIEEIKPEKILALGNVALWALTGEKGITKWRGSMLDVKIGSHACRVIPTYHPAAILRRWDWRGIAVHDMRRLHSDAKPPEWQFNTSPTAIEVLNQLQEWNKKGGKLAGDIETRDGHIICFGIADSPTHAMCIPFWSLTEGRPIYTEAEEVLIVKAIRDLFANKQIKWVFQNGLYDLQYFYRHWHMGPVVSMDTMVAHHLCFLGYPKSLDFISSLYCEHYVYWKDDGKEWDTSVPEKVYREYNCTDCCRTWECSSVIENNIKRMQLEGPFKFQMDKFDAYLTVMLRGIRKDTKRSAEVSRELEEALIDIQAKINYIVGHPLNPQSPKQMISFFYDELGLTPVKNKEGRPTCNKEALAIISNKYPFLKRLVDLIEAHRSTRIFKSTFVDTSLDVDGRIRCYYNISGTETLRESSSANAFGSGGNLQNIPSGGADLPNVRKLFLPDEGYIIGEVDLDRADAFVVAWEADDEELKELLLAEDIHTENAKAIFGAEAVKRSPIYRHRAKIGVHATNYGVKARTLSKHIGVTVREAEFFIKRWLGAHPKIAEWHQRVERQLRETRSVSNKFGFRRIYFERVDSLLPQALAWIPQSTVANVIDKGLCNIHRSMPEVEVLMQVHDSLIFQYKKREETEERELLRKLREMLLVKVPYEKPLVIPVGLKLSPVSWGDATEKEWP